MKRVMLIATLMMCATSAFGLGTFPPASFKNLQVLPKSSSMRAVPRQAGAEARVTCITCHRGKSTPDNIKPQ